MMNGDSFESSIIPNVMKILNRLQLLQPKHKLSFGAIMLNINALRQFISWTWQSRFILFIFTSKLSAIVSSKKFFEIDLMNLSQNECDKTLAHTYKSKPFNSFGINGYEYLLCFEDFGVFVDEYGRRSRSNDIK